MQLSLLQRYSRALRSCLEGRPRDPRSGDRHYRTLVDLMRQTGPVLDALGPMQRMLALQCCSHLLSYLRWHPADNVASEVAGWGDLFTFDVDTKEQVPSKTASRRERDANVAFDWVEQVGNG